MDSHRRIYFWLELIGRFHKTFNDLLTITYKLMKQLDKVAHS